jgi:hypothetical protein
MNIKTRLRREPLPTQQGYNKTDRPQRRTRRLKWWRGRARAKMAKEAERAKTAKEAERAKMAKEAERAKMAKEAERAKMAKEAERAEMANMDKKQLSEDEEEIRATMPKKSKVFSKDEFTIVDSGTTVSIDPGKRNLSNIDELKFVKIAVLERSLYDANADLDIEEKQEEAHKDPSDLGESPSTIRQATAESQSPGGLGESPSTTRQATRDSDADDSDTLTDGVLRSGARALPSRTRPDPRSGGKSRTRSSDQMVIPERRAAIGAPQDLDDEEKDFLKIAFELKLPMVIQQRNLKTQRSTSRARYENF